MFGMPGWIEIGIIALVVMIVFKKKVPENMRSIGKGVLEVRKALNSNQGKITRIFGETLKKTTGKRPGSKL